MIYLQPGSDRNKCSLAESFLRIPGWNKLIPHLMYHVANYEVLFNDTGLSPTAQIDRNSLASPGDDPAALCVQTCRIQQRYNLDSCFSCTYPQSHPLPEYIYMRNIPTGLTGASMVRRSKLREEECPQITTPINLRDNDHPE